jgi:hypothetical protein
MRKNLIFLIFILLVSCGSQTGNVGYSEPNPVFPAGKWIGEGHFLNRELDKNFGSVPFELNIGADHSVTGTAGDAALTRCSIEKSKYGFELRAILNGKLKQDKALSYDHLIVLLVIPDDSTERMHAIDAGFHLKRNYFFDPGMRVGGVMLKKQN